MHVKIMVHIFPSVFTCVQIFGLICSIEQFLLHLKRFYSQVCQTYNSNNEAELFTVHLSAWHYHTPPQTTPAFPLTICLSLMSFEYM